MGNFYIKLIRSIPQAPPEAQVFGPDLAVARGQVGRVACEQERRCAQERRCGREQWAGAVGRRRGLEVGRVARAVGGREALGDQALRAGGGMSISSS